MHRSPYSSCALSFIIQPVLDGCALFLKVSRYRAHASRGLAFAAAHAHIIPSCSLALSDILPGFHGGSQTMSTLALLMPSMALIFDSTSTGSDAATGQFGAVKVILIRTSADSLISIP